MDAKLLLGVSLLDRVLLLVAALLLLLLLLNEQNADKSYRARAVRRRERCRKEVHKDMVGIKNRILATLAVSSRRRPVESRSANDEEVLA